MIQQGHKIKLRNAYAVLMKQYEHRKLEIETQGSVGMQSIHISKVARVHDSIETFSRNKLELDQSLVRDLTHYTRQASIQEDESPMGERI